MNSTFEYALIVRDKTRLERLVERYNTKMQARFYIDSTGGDFDLFQIEHDNFYRCLERVEQELSFAIKYKIVAREYLPSFIFSENQLIIVIGQDGLVANTAKYVGNQPIIAVNPDPGQYNGVLLPYESNTFIDGFESVMNQKASFREVTMARATTNDGQRLTAFNDFCIGAATHVSARYKVNYSGRSELQSSSGVLIATGAGSTGWLSSVFNMQQALNGLQGVNRPWERRPFDWGADYLLYVVREPYLSHATGIDLVAGVVDRQKPLIIDSLMPENGVIFSDGIEKDFLRFNAGTTVTIGLADQRAKLIMS
jgi:hypothetical protein